MSYELIISWLQATLRWSAPLLVVASGEVLSERSGIINMGIEGIMLCGALCGVAISYFTGNVWTAMLVTMLMGAILGFGVAYLTVSRRTNQVVTGLMINMLATGGTNLVFSLLSATRSTRVNIFPQLFPGFLQQIPVIGPIFFAQPITTYIALILPFIVAFVLYKTNWGLNVRAVGDNPQAASTAGLSVVKIKYQTVILSGMFAAMGGCFLTLAETGFFASGGMTNGRGFIVLAAVVVGGWDPIRTAIACIIFGAADALQLRMQVIGSTVPYQFLQMLPYIITVVALTIMVKKSRVPKTWGAPYNPKEF